MIKHFKDSKIKEVYEINELTHDGNFIYFTIPNDGYTYCLSRHIFGVLLKYAKNTIKLPERVLWLNELETD